MATPRKLPQDKLKVGRPSGYRPEFCELVITCGEQGYSFTEMAVATGYTRDSLRRWEQEHPEFSVALTRAKDLAQAWWEKKARDGVDNSKFNAALWAKVVGSRYRDDYGDKVRTEITGKDGGPVSIAATTVDARTLEPEHREALKQALLAAKAVGGK